ncbi:MAG: A/G-specific adenine glycosylase [Pirellula sp.]|nr:A/G-specific adenine glycosylase [Pirellula sp.]
MKRWSKPELSNLRTAAIKWFEQHGRPLPWRSTRDPYRIWVSEIMLQQTVVAAVIPYYHKFLSSFPDIISLANADEQLVLQHWAGLGYYRRAKQLHAAAKVVRDTYHGTFPSDFSQVLDLPGVGRYTAGAILSFAFDQSYPIVEANTQRLYARLLRLPGQLTERPVQTALWNFAESFLPDGPGSGEINQAMMEIGSQVCTPKTPRCTECPLAKYCPTYKHNEQEQIPSPKPAKIYEERQEAVLMIQNTQREFLMRRCGPGERWAGLWDFPRFCVTNCKTEPQIEQHLKAEFAKRFCIRYKITTESSPIKHGVTRYKITLRCFHGLVDGPWQVSENLPEIKSTSDQTTSDQTNIEHRWCSLAELSELPLSSTGKKLSIRLGEADVPKPQRIANNKKARKTHR